MFGKLYRDLEQDRNRREHEAAEADPKAHKLSRVMLGRGGLNYRWYPAGRNGRNQIVRFCWSLHRNCAGYFLGWREVQSKTQVKRDRWIARKSRNAVKKLAQRRAGKTNPAVTLT